MDSGQLDSVKQNVRNSSPGTSDWTGAGLSRANVLIFTALTPSLQIIWGAERWNNGSSVHRVQQHPEAIFNRYSISYCPSTFSAADQLSYFHYIGNTH